MVKCVYLEGSWATKTGIGVFGPTERTDHTAIDGHDLASQIEGACNEFERNGYSILSVSTKIDGFREFGFQSGAGWSYTAGAIVVARREG